MKILAEFWREKNTIDPPKWFPDADKRNKMLTSISLIRHLNKKNYDNNVENENTANSFFAMDQKIMGSSYRNDTFVKTKVRLWQLDIALQSS